MSTNDTKPLPLPSQKHNLTGWAVIEEYLQKHDSGMIKDYADDIDTLLVFAGLFSAVLTAFVVETYTMLQQDSTDVTNRLLEGITSALSPASGNTTVAASTPVTFTPSTAARWINILFFLSLVSSLSAALFGILAKQWLREYMKWNSALGTPRENVLIRQIRFEAWQAWHVAATISSIPALLEVAMILFLFGVIDLLWTLDTVVAIVVTLAVIAFVGAASAFTILPVFFRRCPYKSPTSWACVVLSDFILSIAVFSARYGMVHARNICRGLRYWRFTASKFRWESRPPNWRRRDRGCCSTVASNDVRKALSQAVEIELGGLREDGTPVNAVHAFKSTAIMFSTQAMKDLSESSLLFRALAWVQQASQDTHLRTHIVESLSSLHSDIGCDDKVHHAIRTVSDWCLLWSLQTRNFEQPKLGLVKAEDGATGILAVQRQVRNLWTSGNVPRGCNNIHTRARQRALHGAVYLIVTDNRSSTLLFADLVAADLHAAVVKFRAGHWSLTSGRLVLELLCVLSTVCMRYHLPSSSFHLRGVQALIGDNNMNVIVDAMCPGLRSSAFMVACRLGTVECENGVITVTPSSGTDSSHLARLICRYFTRDIHEYGPEDIHIFILLVNEWLLLLSPQSSPLESPDLTDVIWNKMANLVQFSLRAKLQNCGCFFDLPWPYRLSARYQNYLLVLIGSRRHEFLRLLHFLDRANGEGLITGPQAATISNLLIISHVGYAVVCVEPRCKFHHDAVAIRQVEDNLGSADNYSRPPNRPLQPSRMSNRPREWPIIPLGEPDNATFDTSEATEYAFKAFSGVIDISRDEATAYVNIWRWFCDPATGFRLVEKNVAPFLASLPSTFALGIYPEEYSTRTLLQNSPYPNGSDHDDGVILTEGVNVSVLMANIKCIDRESVRRRRNMFIWLYHRARFLLKAGLGVSFDDMVVLIVRHLAVSPDDSSNLQRLLQNNESNREIIRAVENDRTTSLLTMIVLRRRFLATRRDRTFEDFLSH